MNLFGHPHGGRHFVWGLVLLAGGLLGGAQSTSVERFDTTGMPRRATNFAEQQILEMIGSHKRGDMADAARIQLKLGRYFADKGDESRATAAFQRAAAAEETEHALPTAAESAAPPPSRRPSSPVPASSGTGVAGGYFGYDGRTLHTWDFSHDGSFLHPWIASGSGSTVRNSERGRFQVVSDRLELVIGSTASSFVTPATGGRSTQAGGTADASTATRRLRIEFIKSDNSIVLDVVKLKPKSW